MRFELVRELLRYDQARKVYGVTLMDIMTVLERDSKAERYQRKLEKIDLAGAECLDYAAQLTDELYSIGFDVGRVVFWLNGDSRYLIWTSANGYFWGNTFEATRSEGQRLTFGREDFLHV